MFDPELVHAIRSRVRDVPEFPQPGILFRDLTPVFAHGPTYRALIRALAAHAERSRPEAIVGIESRGFLLGAPLAVELGLGFTLVRKAGKLPYKTHHERYALEYGEASVEIHQDALEPGSRVFLVDDLLATGGTMAAAIRLVRRFGAEVIEAAFLVELGFLPGRAKMAELQVPMTALLAY